MFSKEMERRKLVLNYFDNLYLNISTYNDNVIVY